MQSSGLTQHLWSISIIPQPQILFVHTSFVLIRHPAFLAFQHEANRLIAPPRLFFFSSKQCLVHLQWVGNNLEAQEMQVIFLQGAREGLPEDQGEQVIRLNPLFGSVSFASRPASEQSILQTLIHHPEHRTMMDELGHQQGPRWMGVIHHCREPMEPWVTRAMAPSTPIGARARRRTEPGGGWHRAKKTSLGDVPTTLGTFCLSYYKVGRCLMEFAAETRST